MSSPTLTTNSSKILQIYPNYLCIPNFNTEHTYKETITFYNKSSSPITFTLSSNDKQLIKISDSNISLNSCQTKHIYILIRDDLNYSNNTKPHQRLIFLHIKTNLFEEKYQINLLYNTFNPNAEYLQNIPAPKKKISKPKQKTIKKQSTSNKIKYKTPLQTSNIINIKFIKEQPKQDNKDIIINKLKEDKQELISYINITLNNKWKQMDEILNRYDNELFIKCHNAYKNNELYFSKQDYFSYITDNYNNNNNINPNDNKSSPSLHEINTLKSYNNLLITENNLLSQNIRLIEEKLSVLYNNKLNIK